MTLPEKEVTFQEIEMVPYVQKSLKNDVGATGKWQEGGGADWSVYWLRWEQKTMQSAMSARYHRPEICLSGHGLRQVSEPTVEYFDTGRLKLPFRKYIFSGQGQMFYVFFCLWQDGDEFRKGMRWYKLADRLLMALEGRRRYGQQTLEIITTGYSSMEQAERAVRQRLPSLIRIDPQPNPPRPSNGGTKG